MNVVWPSDDGFNNAVADWVASNIWPGQGKKLPPSRTMAVFDDNREIQAAVAFHDYHADTGVVEISSAAVNKMWLTRPVLAELFGYAFNQLQCQMVVARIDPDKKSHLRIFKAYGFKAFEIPRLLGRNKSQIIVTLTIEDWRANKFKHPK